MPYEEHETMRHLETTDGITFFNKDRIMLTFPASVPEDDRLILSTMKLEEGQIIPLRIMNFDVRPPFRVVERLYVECAIEDIDQAQFVFIEQDAFLRYAEARVISLDMNPLFRKARYVNRFTGVEDEVALVTAQRDTLKQQYHYVITKRRGKDVSFEMLDEREMIRRYNPVEFVTEGVEI